MKNNQIKILSIETSCDETSAAVIGVKNGNPVILSNVVSSQIDLHAKTGGVVPEVASRAHIESVIPIINETLKEANYTQNFNENRSTKKLKLKPITLNLLSQITHVAVTSGPGLIGSLLVGIDTAKSLAYALGLPIIPINHIEGHIYSALCKKIPDFNHLTTGEILSPEELKNKRKTMSLTGVSAVDISFPILALTASGGHTSLTLMSNHGKYQTVGETIDDAAGEAFDKVAKLLDLGYPGGPIVSQYANAYRETISKPKLHIHNKNRENKRKSTKEIRNDNFDIKFPRPMLDKDNYDFSFSGLKTAVLYLVQKITKNDKCLTQADKRKICYEFEEAVIDVLSEKTLRAVKELKPKAVVLAGGVSANKRLRAVLGNKLKKEANKLLMPPLDLCGDNAAMIGLAAYYHILNDEVSTWNKVKVDSNLRL